MTVDEIFKTLETGNIVTTTPSDSLINAMQILMKETYKKCEIDVQIFGSNMILTPLSEFIKK